jgi:hypothetical protein
VPACIHCGETESVELLEVWEDRGVSVATCCEAFQEEVLYELQHPDAATALLRRLGIEQITGHVLRRCVDDGMGHLVLDWQLRLAPIGFAAARAFVAAHHTHSRPPVGWRFGSALFNGPDMIGVAIVGRPVVRGFDPERVVEVTRLCLRRDVPEPLVWNGCSMLYGWAAREARRRGFARIVTYVREDETGASLQAAGWTNDGVAGGGQWSCRSRPRAVDPMAVRRRRWSRILRTDRAASLPLFAAVK